jgi:hypothetical protein
MASLENRSTWYDNTGKAIFVVGVLAVAVLAVARWHYEPSFQVKTEKERMAMQAELAATCDKLGKPPNSPDREACLKTIEEFEMHARTIVAAGDDDI